MIIGNKLKTVVGAPQLVGELKTVFSPHSIYLRTRKENIMFVGLNADDLAGKLDKYFREDNTVTRYQFEMPDGEDYPVLAYLETNDHGPYLWHEPFADLFTDPDFKQALAAIANAPDIERLDSEKIDGTTSSTNTQMRGRVQHRVDMQNNDLSNLTFTPTHK